MSDNPLLVTESHPDGVIGLDLTNPFSGLRLIEDIADLKDSIEGGSWLGGAFAVGGGVMDALQLIKNPIEELIAMFVGWIIEHLYPLNEWFEELTGDSGAVNAASATWVNIQSALQLSAEDTLDVLTPLADQHGLTIEAIRELVEDMSAHIAALSGLAGAIGKGLSIAAVIVQVVHCLVRDALADCVAFIVHGLAVAAGTFGVGLAWIIPELVSLVNKWVTRLKKQIDDLIRAFERLKEIFRESDNLLEAVKKVFAEILPKKASADAPDVDGAVPPKSSPDADPTPTKPKKEPKYPAKGTPNSYGYDEFGNRLPYANNRPSYAPGQVDEVWDAAVKASPDGQVRVLGPDGEYHIVEWEPGQPRQGTWDMGHLTGEEYAELHRQYMNHEITREEFLQQYRDPANYEVQDPSRNRSHVDEAR
ncbi:MAG: HNH/ENDO VII family nuclease [Propionibacteriaceae bacterium]|jgi:DNA-binding transcriptional MerR regulator|nr:HNH/ENDO VII family nuclease [Propionibacteriaceae bacterium]